MQKSCSVQQYANNNINICHTENHDASDSKMTGHALGFAYACPICATRVFRASKRTQTHIEVGRQ